MSKNWIKNTNNILVKKCLFRTTNIGVSISSYVITLVLLLSFMSCSKYNRQKDKEMNINGIITKKYIKELGEVNVIQVNNNNVLLTPWIKRSSNNLDKGNIWDYIDLGDSIYKAEGSLKMKVIKPSGEYQVFDYYYENGW